MTREGWQSAIIQYRLYIGMMPLRLRGRLKTSRLVEAARELAIGIVFELGGEDRPLYAENRNWSSSRSERTSSGGSKGRARCCWPDDKPGSSLSHLRLPQKRKACG